MDAHRLAEARSLAYHKIIADRIRDDPRALRIARDRVDDWRRQTPVPHYASRWGEILSRTPDQIASFLVEDSEIAIELRQSSPFAGALSPGERWQIWRETRAAVESRRDT